MATVLRYYGVSANEHACIEALKPAAPAGIDWWGICKYMRTRGFEPKEWVHYTGDQLTINAREGIPSLLEWPDWSGHWVVHIGYDPDTQALIFLDPSDTRSPLKCYSLQKFEHYWDISAKRDIENPPVTLVIPPSRDPEKDFSRSKKLHPNRILRDWRTKVCFSKRQQHALS